MMRTVPTSRRGAGNASITRSAVGLVWLAGAAFNGFVTLRMADPYSWLADGSRLRVYRWLFREVIGAHPTRWTLLLVAGEAALGVLTLARGGWAKLGLAGGALFSAFLFTLATPYTLLMGPYALLLAWLARRDEHQSAVGRLAGAIARRGAGRTAAP